MQAGLFQWVFTHEEQFPDLKWVVHWPNGGYRGARAGGAMKKQGVRKGPLDVWCLVRRGDVPGCVIELKSKGRKTSEEQEAWLAHLDANGWECHVVWEEWRLAARVLCRFLGLPQWLEEGLLL